MRLRALALAALLAAPAARATPWYWLSPTPGGFPINGVAFPTASTGFFVGAQGTILATRDGGNSYQGQSVPTSADLYGVYFLSDGLTGWVVGDQGTILHTTDGGTTWEAQGSPTTRRLYAVTFTDSLHGFAAGEERALLQTADGGATWTLRDGQLLTLNALAFPDAQHGFAAGWGGSVLLTTDGGNSWSPVQTGSIEDLLAVSFVDPDHGWAVGAAGTILATSDGGHSWQAQGVGVAPDDLVGVVASSATTAYAVGTSGTFYYTLDGKSWQQGNWFYQDTLTALAAAPGGALWATGASGHVYQAAAASPGAQLFVDENRALGVTQNVTGLAFGDSQHGVLATSFFLYYTDSGGQTLQVGSVPQATVSTRPTPSWTAAAMPTPSIAYAVGTGGGVVKSTNGGASWSWLSDSDTFTQNDLYAVWFADATHGWIAGSGGLILSTQDGGASWRTTMVPAGNLRAIWFADATHGFAAGDYGALASTQDGVNWTPVGQPPGGSTLYALGGVPPGFLFAGGAAGFLAASPDDGQSWYQVESPTNGDIEALWFVDPLDGFMAVGKPGLILVTHDGGNSWTRQLTGVPSLLALSFPDALHGFAGGAAGSLLGTVTGGEPACQAATDCAALADGGSTGFQCASGACTACNQNASCGLTCAPCADPTPFCLGAFCGQCRTTADCTDGGTCVYGGCVVNVPVPDDGGFAFDGGGGQDGGGGIVTVLPDGGIRINPAAACGCGSAGGSPFAAFFPLLLGGWLLARRRRVS